MKFKDLDLLSRWTIIKTVDEAMFLDNDIFPNIIGVMIHTFIGPEEEYI